MKTALHIQQRMSQRGMSKDIIQCVIDFGIVRQDKYCITRDLANFYISQIKNELNKRHRHSRRY